MNVVKHLIRKLSSPELDERTKTAVARLNFGLYRIDNTKSTNIDWFFYDLQQGHASRVNVVLQTYNRDVWGFDYDLLLEAENGRLKIKSGRYLNDPSSSLPIARGVLDETVRTAEEIRRAGYETTINDKPIDVAINLFDALGSCRPHIHVRRGELFYELFPSAI